MDEPIAFLVRHGEDEFSDAGINVSWIDAALTDKGRKQAEDAFEILDNYDIEKIYSSPLQRTFWMAEQFAKKSGIGEFAQHRGLLPWNRGIFTGIRQETTKEVLEMFIKNPKLRIPQGESRVDCEDRLESFFVPALKEAEKSTTVFFTHHSVIDVLNCLLEGKRSEEIRNLVKTGGIVAIYVDGDGYRMNAIFREDQTPEGVRS